MNKGEIFNILNIEETKDKDIIRTAYMDRLSVTNPEDDPEGFKLLRQAYDEALRLADEGEDNTPVGQWMRSVEDTYNDFSTRCDIWAWEELFEDEVVTDEGTFTLARERLLRFLAYHMVLPREVFELVDNAFRITEDYEELTEVFPEGFCVFLIRHGNNLNLSIMSGNSGEAVDKAYELWLDFRHFVAIEDKKSAEEKINEYLELAERENVKMPYFTASLAEYYLNDGETEKARELLSEIEGLEDKDEFIGVSSAHTYVRLGEKEKARELYDKLKDKYSKNLALRAVGADLLMADGNYADAKKEFEDIYAETNNPEIFDSLQMANSLLISDMENGIESKTDAQKIELGWCYYQNEENEKLMELLDSFFPTSEDDLRMYYNIRSRALLVFERCEEALECVEKWRELLFKQTTETEQDEKDKKRRIVLSAFFGARTLRVMYEKNKDRSLLQRALTYAEEPCTCDEWQVQEQLIVEHASLLDQLDCYEEAVELCTSAIEREPECVPAYLIRQHCNFKLRKAGAVLEDYRTIMEYVPNLDIGLPYARAAHIFIIFDRYGDALDIVKRADENNVQSDYVEYVRASAMRYLAKNERDTEKVLDVILPIADKKPKDMTDCDKHIQLEIYCEVCFAYMDLKIWDKAVKYINKAIAHSPNDAWPYKIKLDVYKQSDNNDGIKKTISQIKRAFKGETFPLLEEAKLLENNDRKRAIMLYRQALKLDESCVEACDGLRELYRRNYCTKLDKRFFNTAVTYADKSIELNASPKQYLERGILYMNGGVADKAEEDMRKAIDLDDEYIVAIEWLADLLRIECRHNEAVNSYKEAYELAKGNGNYYPVKDYALGCEALRDYDKAVELLKELKRDYPNEGFSWNYLGRVYQKMGENELAYQNYLDYRNKFGINDANITDLDEDLLEVGLLLPNKGDEVFKLLSETLKANKGSAMAYYNMAQYYCYYKNDKKNTHKFIAKALNATQSEAVKRRIYREHLKLCYVLRDNVKTAFIKMTAPLFDDLRPYRDMRYKKMELYNLGMRKYYEGKTLEAVKAFKAMQTGINCVNCSYNYCVEAEVGKAIILAEKGDYAQAVEILEGVIGEAFDVYVIKKFIERFREKIK
jgi:tetratricopeptide (TPR) repeat protein